MDKIKGKLTVYFEGQFWVGIFETIKDNKLKVSKIIFGPEPKDQEIYQFILKNYHKLNYSPAVDVIEKKEPKNPKVRQRKLKKETAANTKQSTKSQQAIKLQIESKKQEKKKKRKQNKEQEKTLKFQLKKQKRKAKHKGK